jgi:hypothetical protein
MKAGIYIDYYDDIFIVYPDKSVDLWMYQYGWVKTTVSNVTGSWKLIELL